MSATTGLRCAMSTHEQGRCAALATTVGLIKNFHGWAYTAVCAEHLALLRSKLLIRDEEPADPTKWSDDGRWVGGDE